MFCVHGAQRAFGEQAECTQNKTEPAALAAATGNRKGAVAPLQCQGVWGRNAPNSLNRIPDPKANDATNPIRSDSVNRAKLLSELLVMTDDPM